MERKNNTLNKIRTWCIEHLIHIQSVLLFCVSIVSIVSGINQNYAVMAIAVLVFVGTEFFILALGYLERIIDRVNNMSIEQSILIDGIKFDLEPYVKKAKHSVFICGATLSSLTAYRSLFSNLPNYVKLELILLDNTNEALLFSHYCMVGGQNTPENLRIQFSNFKILVSELSKRKNTFIKCIDYPMPITYVGIDIDNVEPHSIIKSQHYTNFIHGDEYPMGFIVKPGSKMFYIYKKQIRNLQESTTKEILINP